MSLSPRVVVVHRRTEYDELIRRHGTRGQAAFFLSTRGRDLAELEERHQLTREALDRVADGIPVDWRRGTVEREDIARFLFAPDDIVVVVGQDGLVAKGPNVASSVKVSDTLPSDVTFKTGSIPCTAAGHRLTCQLGTMINLDTRSFTITAAVPADLVYVNGGPKTITNTAVATNLWGPDADPTDNSATATTQAVAVADVAVTDAQASGPLEVLIGKTASASLVTTVANGGPSSPIDAVLTTTASGNGGVTVTPASATTAITALAVDTPQHVTNTVSLRCDKPGSLTNNQASSSFTVDCVVPIVSNVRPHGFPNSINLNTDATLAALTTKAGEYGLPLDFDATQIDVSTTLWGLRSNLLNTATPTGAKEIHGIGHPEDSYELDEKTRDGDLDLILHFKPADSGLQVGSTEACLKGKYTAPNGARYTYFGCDSVRVTTK